MRRCLALARRAEGRTAPNPIVGSVIVSPRGRVLAEGFHAGPGTPQGEAAALAAIQLGWLMKSGAVAWKTDETAANEKDKGCFSIALDKFHAAVKTLMTELAQTARRRRSWRRPGRSR